MLNITAQTIPHSEQRYDTVGDYWRTEITDEYHDGTVEKHERLDLRVSDLGNEDYEFLVLIHELIEEHLTRNDGIPEPVIKAFDEQFEQERAQGLHAVDAEPGHDPRAPYRAQHAFAELIERLVAYELGVNWQAYEKAIEAL